MWRATRHRRFGADLELAWAAERATDTSTDVMRAISQLDGTQCVVVVALAVTVAEVRRLRRWAVAAFVASTVVGQFALSNGIKWIVDRARPTISPLTGFAGTSFPSGHAVAAAATWACVAFLVGRDRHRHARAGLLGGAFAIAVSVAATRVALGVHWTTDVVAGLLVGWTWFALCAIAIAFGGRVLHFGEPVDVIESEAGQDDHRQHDVTRTCRS